MSSPLAINLLREFTNWRPRTNTKKCQKCKHEYSRTTIIMMITDILTAMLVAVNAKDLLMTNNGKVYFV
jgi:hypothetical protein